MTSRRNCSLLLASAGLLAASTASAQTLISDDFEVDTSANYTAIDDGTPDGTRQFAFDYVGAGVPLAPRSAAGTRRGIRFTVNDTAGAVDALTLYHNTPVTAAHYKLTVDVYMAFSGTVGTTEHAHVGVGGNGTTFNQLFSPISGSGAYIAFTGDGGSGSDYRWFRDPLNTPAGETDNTTLPNSHPSYLGNGSNNTGPFFQSLFPSPPATIAGSPGNIWTTVEIDVDNTTGVISFFFDQTLTFQGNFANAFSGLVSIGLADVFTSLGATNFTLFDNLVVEEVGGAIGVNYCNPNANSTGATGRISASGSNIATNNNLTLLADRLPNNSFGFFLTSQSQGFIQNPGGSAGNLCLSGGIGRYVGPGQIKNSGTAGAFSLALNLTQTPQPTGTTAVTAGQTWNFTTWYRDVVGGSATSNFTDGFSVSFQ